MAGLGIALFVIPRLLKTELVGARYASLGAALWNADPIAGLGSVGLGISDGPTCCSEPRRLLTRRSCLAEEVHRYLGLRGMPCEPRMLLHGARLARTWRTTADAGAPRHLRQAIRVRRGSAEASASARTALGG